MSPDLERRLRDAASTLGTPGPSVTKQAREAALAAAARRRRQRARGVGIAGAMLAAVALGVGIGSLALTGSGEAGRTQGLSFLPADGWVVRQAGTPAIPSRPGVALAANVQLDPQDTADGFPYATLQALPDDGIVLIASFFRLDGPQGSQARLPLRLSDARPYIRWGGQVRPEKPLAQYELRTVVEGLHVEVHAYFGMREPSAAMLAEAQRQLDRLVASPETDGGVPRMPAIADAVTIAFQRFWYPPGNYLTMRFYGTISSGQANEYVTVVKKECGASFSTAIAGTLTQPGGAWEAQPDRPPGGGEFRAKWNDELSEPVTYRQPMVPSIQKIGPSKFQATVTSYAAPGATRPNLAGRRIDLQRLVAGEWTRMRSARLVRKRTDADSFFWSFVATFTVTTRGLKVRAYVPAKTAAPCLAAGASKPVRT